MPEFVSCPDPACGKKLRVPDELMGKKVKCPGCARMFIAGEPGQQSQEKAQETPPEEELPEEKPTRKRSSRLAELRRARRESAYADNEEDDIEEEEDHSQGVTTSKRRSRRSEDDRVSGPRRRGSRSSWLEARDGINLVMLSGYTVLGLCGFVYFLIGLAILIPHPAVAWVGWLFLFAGMVVVLVLALKGYSRCRATPPNGGTTQLLAKIVYFCYLGAFLLSILACVMAICGGLAGVFLQSGGLLIGLAILLYVLYAVISLLTLVGWIGWIIYLYAVSRQVEDYGAAQVSLLSTISLSLWWLLWAIIPLALQAVVAQGSAGGLPGGAAGVGGGMLGFLIGGLVALTVYLAYSLLGLSLYVWYLFVLQRVRDALTSYAFRG
jgi:hypothetical protein